MDMGPAGTYLIFGWNGVQRGGIYNKPADMPAPPNWLPYVRVPDTDTGYGTATGSGARAVNGPMDVPGGHRIATFFDPTGAAIAIVSMPEQEEGAAEEPKAAPRVKTKAKAKPKAKVSAKAKGKAKSAAPKKKKKAARKPGPKKKVARKAARKPAKKSAPKKKSAAKKKGTARRKK
jgi:predicted enzyme related to lactoylglutathione lyase